MASERPVPEAVRDRLRCPRCGGRVAAVAGGLGCDRGHTMAWAGGVLDGRAGVPEGEGTTGTTGSTLRSFGYEWTAFADVRAEDEVFWGRYTELLPLDRLGGAVALDAGCGKGRFSVFTARHVGALVALDGSDAVDVAARNLAGEDGVVVVRADVRQVPLADASIDLVTCFGVLHHLDDPRAGFDALARLLAPGGRFLLYVYSRPTGRGLRSVGLAGATALRRLTVRMPHRLLRGLSAPIARGRYLGRVLPGALGARLGWRRPAAWPLATYRGAPLRSLWLDTFDRLSAPVEHRYTAAEVERWFRDAGLAVTGVRDEPDLAGIVVLGSAP
jgi:SAM-dependent methyltransferase